MLMLLAKEVVEKQNQFDLELVKIAIQGLVTLATVFVGAFLAYLFSRKANKKSFRNEREVQYIIEFQKDLISFVREYTTFVPILMKNLEAVKLKAYDAQNTRDMLCNALYDQRKILFKFKDLITRSKSLENISNIGNVYSKFCDFHSSMNNEIELTMDALDEGKKVLNGECSTIDYKVNYEIYNFDSTPYENVMIEIQKFIFKK